MPILVVEGARPNGDDLVLGDHLLNDVAKRNGASRETHLEAVRLVDIGEGYALKGFYLQPGVSPEGEVVCFLVAEVLKPSQLVNVQTVAPVAIGVIGKTTAASLRAAYEKALNPEHA